MSRDITPPKGFSWPLKIQSYLRFLEITDKSIKVDGHLRIKSVVCKVRESSCALKPV